MHFRKFSKTNSFSNDLPRYRTRNAKFSNAVRNQNRSVTNIKIQNNTHKLE